MAEVERIIDSPGPTQASVASMRYNETGYVAPWEYDYLSNTIRDEAPVFPFFHPVYCLKIRKARQGRVVIEYNPTVGG
jgi:hypothetical protein